MSEKCGSIVAYESEWITLTKISDGSLIASFKAKEDICKKMLERMIVFKYNESIENVKIKIGR